MKRTTIIVAALVVAMHIIGVGRVSAAVIVSDLTSSQDSSIFTSSSVVGGGQFTLTSAATINSATALMYYDNGADAPGPALTDLSMSIYSDTVNTVGGTLFGTSSNTQRSRASPTACER